MKNQTLKSQRFQKTRDTASSVSYTHLDVYKRQVKALGLTKMHKTVEMPDNGAVRGMVAAVRHLVKVEEV